jgi:hypothetical protein
MGVGRRGIKGARGRGQVPGRPSTARRDNRVRFWRAIARGATTEEASIEAGVSGSVGSHWFGQAGGMPPLSLVPLSGRYLSFADREEIAILYAQEHGVREIARRLGRPPSTISRELERNTSVNDYRTPMACCASTSPRAPAWPGTVGTTSTPLLSRSTRDRARLSTGRRQPKPLTSSYTRSNKTVLQRPLEPAHGWAPIPAILRSSPSSRIAI